MSGIKITRSSFTSNDMLGYTTYTYTATASFGPVEVMNSEYGLLDGEHRMYIRNDPEGVTFSVGRGYNWRDTQDFKIEYSRLDHFIYSLLEIRFTNSALAALGEDRETVNAEGFFPAGVRLDYRIVHSLIARILAEAKREEPSISHANVATEILWEYLSDEDRSRAVLR